MKVPAALVTGLVGALLPMAVPAAAGPIATPTATAVTGTARTGGTALTMRRMPSPVAEKTGTIANGGRVAIVCQVTAQRITGTVRTTNLWDRLANGHYVSDAYVRRPATPIPACPAAVPPAPPAPAPSIPAPTPGESWGLPVTAGLVSGFRTVARPAHDGVDLSARRETPILAAAAGTVIRVVCNVSAGTCDVDGKPALRGCGWYVEVQHAGKVVTRYCHMVRRPVVAVGQAVTKGQLLGHVGTSGSSSGPHLHFEVHVEAAPAIHDNAVDPIAFLRSRGVSMG
ncbi:peptidoglycan DD-metalloendopeptidase family protein [Actinoplanes sp. NEAU-A12]|uniref:Peptidoglycan DD-metalloendopeptidase family protein n=1 Tax=Actinoplanes sandaracinus TaxID=3045177 RepID=A0ABT6WJK7_9ACTN|nr:peptidoglycan DD-metalloendopeptidase family protein [Actinoplanes sandaracinus]MDI6099911.1 peptidoglycan DD-metalloendopeptidase family protein [Actinoplanes sandaracinus]